MISNSAQRTGFGATTSAVRTNDLPSPTGTASPERVDAVLRSIPSHGWPAGWVGRRDRSLLVLSQWAGLSFLQIAALTAGDLTVAGGVATIRTTGGRTRLHQVDDDLLCGPCALARWVHALDLTVVYPDGRVIAALIARAVPVTAESPHLCHSNNSITEITARVALLPPIDSWGHSVRVIPAPSVAHPQPAARNGRGGFLPVQRIHHSVTGTHDPGHRAHLLQARVGTLLNG